MTSPTPLGLDHDVFPTPSSGIHKSRSEIKVGTSALLLPPPLLPCHFHITPAPHRTAPRRPPPHFNALSCAPRIMEPVLIKPSFRSFSCSSGLSAAPIRQKAPSSEFPNVAQHLLKWNSSSNCPPRRAPCLPLTSGATCSEAPPTIYQPDAGQLDPCDPGHWVGHNCSNKNFWQQQHEDHYVKIPDNEALALILFGLKTAPGCGGDAVAGNNISTERKKKKTHTRNQDDVVW